MSEDHPDARLETARRHHQAGRMAEAERLYREILDDAPDDWAVLNKLGAALAAQGRLDDAVAAMEAALGGDPALIDAHANLGLVRYLQGNAGAAAGHFEAVLAHEPDSLQALNGLGAARLAQGQTEAATDAFRRALDVDPGHAEARCNLGIIQSNTGDLEDAVQSFERALAAEPGLVAAQANLGNALRRLGRLDDAAAALERAVQLEPDNAETHWNYSNVLLLQGRLEDGWAEYEWREKCAEFRGEIAAYVEPRWDGAALGGRTILVHAEQGFGDSLQFFRYLPLVAARGGLVVLKCPPALVSLFATEPAVTRVVGDLDGVAFDVHVPLLSLAHVFNTGLDTIPDAVPYVRPPAGAPAPPLAEGGGLRVGIVWSGNPDKKVSKDFSVPLERFRPLLEIGGCDFYSLQVGDARADIARLGLEDALTDWGRDFTDFAQTAAAIGALDLVISIDTAVAHLSGALGHPVWTLLAHVPDWRWLMEGETSPWYPTMRLFRQARPGGWDGVFAAVAEALRERVAETAP